MKGELHDPRCPRSEDLPIHLRLEYDTPCICDALIRPGRPPFPPRSEAALDAEQEQWDLEEMEAAQRLGAKQ